MKNLRQWTEWVLIGGFLMALCLPGLVMIAGKRTAQNAPLGEAVVAPPAWPTQLRQALAAPKQFQKYFQANFGLRDQLIMLNGVLMVRGLGVSTSSRVLVARKDWLLTNEADALLLDYRGLRPFAPAELDHWDQVLRERQAWLQARGIRYLVTIAPEAHWTYPELLPAWLTRVGPGARMDQLLARMKDSPVRLVDLRPALRRAKTTGRLYHRTDGHWNQLGAYAAYAELLTQLHDWFPTVRPLPLTNYRLVKTRTPGGGLARFLGIVDVMPEENLELVPLEGYGWRDRTAARQALAKEQVEIVRNDLIVTETELGDLKNVVLFRDSYCESLLPFLAEHFERASYSWTWTFAFDKELIEREHPELVIQEAVERTLMQADTPR
jgi:hypothetical protein